MSPELRDGRTGEDDRDDTKERRLTDAQNQVRFTEIGTFRPGRPIRSAPSPSTSNSSGSSRAPTSPMATAAAGSKWPRRGAANTISLVPPSEGVPTHTDAAFCAIATDDIEAAHASLRARGVDVDAEIAQKGTPRTGLVSLDASMPDPVPAQFFCRDSTGTASSSSNPADGNACWRLACRSCVSSYLVRGSVAWS